MNELEPAFESRAIKGIGGIKRALLAEESYSALLLGGRVGVFLAESELDGIGISVGEVEYSGRESLEMNGAIALVGVALLIIRSRLFLLLARFV